MDEQKLAKQMLKYRYQGEPSVRAVFIGTSKIHIVRYLILIFAVGYSIILFRMPGMAMWGTFILGLLLGGYAREARMLDYVKASWPFTRKVTNWEAVESIANSDNNIEND